MNPDLILPSIKINMYSCILIHVVFFSSLVTSSLPNRQTSLMFTEKHLLRFIFIMFCSLVIGVLIYDLL